MPQLLGTAVGKGLEFTVQVPALGQFRKGIAQVLSRTVCKRNFDSTITRVTEISGIPTMWFRV